MNWWTYRLFFLFRCLTEQLGNLIHWSFVDESFSCWTEKSTTLYNALHICLEKSWNEEMVVTHRPCSKDSCLPAWDFLINRFFSAGLRWVCCVASAWGSVKHPLRNCFLRWMWVRPQERVTGKLRNDWMTRPATGEWVNIGDSMWQ